MTTAVRNLILCLSILLALALLTPQAHAAPTCADAFSGIATAKRAAHIQLKLAPGRQVDFTYAEAQAGQPTLLLLPGINRGMDMNDAAVKTLRSAGIGIAAINFSTQPFSVAKLPKGQETHFDSKQMTMEDFAAEANYVIAHLQSKGVTDIVPVSLSFSGGASPYIKGVPLIIETVPLTDSAAALGQNSTFQTLAKGNPWLDWIVRSQLDAAYRMTWSKTVDAMIQGEKLNPERREDMIEGYMRMSQATEGFSWKVADLDLKTQRVFIVAEKESPSLLKSQFETYLAYRERNPNAILFFVRDSGHIVLADQPVAYSTILYAVSKNELAVSSGIVVYESATNTTKVIPKENAKAFIEEILKGEK